MPGRSAAKSLLPCAVLLAALPLVAPVARGQADPGAPGPVADSARPDPGYGRDWRGRPYWCQGGNCLAHGRRRLRGADPSSFRPLSGGYAVDRRRVWFQGREVVGGDPASWQVLAPGFARDRQGVHVGIHPVPGLDPARTRYLPRHHLADDRHAVYGEFQSDRAYLRHLDGADAGRLALLPGFSDSLASDGTSLFQAGRRVPVRLAPDFRPLWSGRGVGLAFASGGQLHVLAGPPGDDPRVLAARVPARWQDGLLSLQASWQGDAHWGLADGHLLVAVHEGQLLVLREGVRTLRRLPEAPFHAVVDGRLLFRHPNRPPALVDLGPALGDLRVLDAWRIENGGRRWNGDQAEP